MQTYTSKATSINSGKLPAVFRKASFRSRMVMDYGCGKYTDHIKKHMTELHHAYLPYDPYNQPDERNAVTMTIVCNAMHRHVPVDVVCSNVLNVIDDTETISTIAKDIESIANATGGTGYITVYEGDKSGIGRKTGADQYQRNEKIRSYLRFFSNATIKNGMIVVTPEKH